MSSSSTATTTKTNTTMDELDKIVKQCRQEGKEQKFQQLVQSCEIALNLLSKNNKATEEKSTTAATSTSTSTSYIKRKLQKASVTGFMGYALFKLNKFSEALSYLEESKKCRDDIITKNGTNNNNHNNRINQMITQQQQAIQRREGKVVEQSLKECYAQLGEAAPLPSLIKYPRTTHLFDAGGTSTTSDDLILSDLSSFLQTIITQRKQEQQEKEQEHGEQNGGMRRRRQRRRIVVEEKIDGANLGISMCPYNPQQILVQNRSHYISQGDHAQFNRIPTWVEEHRGPLTDILSGGKYILYGEWVVAKHSIPYKKLPGFFVAFDIYDVEEKKFFSRRKFHTVMEGTRIPVVPTIDNEDSQKIQSKEYHMMNNKTAALKEFQTDLLALLETQSVFRNDDGKVEGVVLRLDADDVDDDDDDDDENNNDDNDSGWLQDKFKLVRPDFIRGCQDGHWATRQIEKQVIDFDFAETYLESCYPHAI